MASFAEVKDGLVFRSGLAAGFDPAGKSQNGQTFAIPSVAESAINNYKNGI
jgi:hypothetical protein